MKTLLKPLLLGIITAARGLCRGRPDHVLFGRQLPRPAIQRRSARLELRPHAFNDRISSAVVHEGRWEICIDSDFRGGCSILDPGAYPNLGAYANRISSVRPLDGRYGDGRADPRHDRDYRAATAMRARPLRGPEHVGPGVSAQ